MKQQLTLKIEDDIKTIFKGLTQKNVPIFIKKILLKWCDICLNPEGKMKTFTTYQPTHKKYEIHKVCEKCINRLVEKYFCLTNVL